MRCLNVTAEFHKKKQNNNNICKFKQSRSRPLAFMYASHQEAGRDLNMDMVGKMSQCISLQEHYLGAFIYLLIIHPTLCF